MKDGNSYFDDSNVIRFQPPPPRVYSPNAWLLHRHVDLSVQKSGKKTRTEQNTNRASVIAPQQPEPHRPAFPHFTTEERLLWNLLGKDPAAGWNPNGIPAFTNSYMNLERMTGHFPNNGQPPEVNKRRVWSTELIRCAVCYSPIAAQWVDRYTLRAGFYCDTCHQDHPLTSYLEHELNRKPQDPIISNSHDYLSENRDFHDFTLFQPNTIALIGAAMGSGKTRAIMTHFVEQAKATAGRSRGILLVPRISLTQSTASFFRALHGPQAWGVFHQASPSRDRFIGEYGCVGTFTSLPAIIRQAKAELIDTDNLLIAVDEADFSYALKDLHPEQSRAIINTLSHAARSTGLVLLGQTQSQLETESFASEIGLDPATAIRGFYSTASPTDSKVNIIRNKPLPGYTNAQRLHSTTESIKTHLKTGKNAYVYCTDRRDVRTLAAVFSELNPVCYTAYTKGERRARAILTKEKLTDSKLFLATSAACVGININDKNAVTLVVVSPRFGIRNWTEAVQESLRNRARGQIEIHYTDSPPALPTAPSKAESVSLYHESLKNFHDTNPHATEHTARANALSTLADSQPETYLEHHLKIAGYTNFEHKHNKPPSNSATLDRIKQTEKQAREAERENVKHIASVYLKRNDILTEHEIRHRSLIAHIDSLSHLAHELLNKAAQGVGWDGERIDNELITLDTEQREAVKTLIEANANLDSLSKRRRGWLAVNHPALVENAFFQAVKDAEMREMESTAVNDDRFLGTVLTALLESFSGETFTQSQLAKRIIETLTAPLPNHKNLTILTVLKRGALGTAIHRQVRFFNKDTFPAIIVDWARRFISTWYPCTIRKTRNRDQYTLNTDYAPQRQLFALWAKHALGEILDTTEPFENTKAKADLKAKKAKAQGLRDGGKTITEIAAAVGESKGWVSRHTTAKKADKKAEAQALRDGGKTIRQIAKVLDMSAQWVAKYTVGVPTLAPNK